MNKLEDKLQMAERRNLDEALLISPDKLAFIQGETSTPPPSPGRRGRKPRRNNVDLSLATPTTQSDVSTRRRRPSQNEATPDANEVLNRVLAPLNTRIPRGLFNTLQLFSLEQRFRHAKPDRIQDIVKAALEDWFAKQNAR